MIAELACNLAAVAHKVMTAVYKVVAAGLVHGLAAVAYGVVAATRLAHSFAVVYATVTARDLAAVAYKVMTAAHKVAAMRFACNLVGNNSLRYN